MIVLIGLFPVSYVSSVFGTHIKGVWPQKAVQVAEGTVMYECLSALASHEYEKNISVSLRLILHRKPQSNSVYSVHGYMLQNLGSPA
jgi:hypothetical protein